MVLKMKMDTKASTYLIFFKYIFLDLGFLKTALKDNY